MPISGPDPIQRLLSLIGRRIGGQEDIPTLPAMRAAPPRTPDGRVRAPDPNRVLRERGILPQMAAEDVERAERIYQAIEPRTYSTRQLSPGYDTVGPMERLPTQSRPWRVLRAYMEKSNSPRVMAPPEREDAWRLYLGLPQISNTFSVSPYRPSRSTNRSAIYLEMPEFLDKVAEFGLQYPDRRMLMGPGANQAVSGYVGRPGESPQSTVIRRMLDLMDEGKDKIRLMDTAVGVMGEFTLAKGRDRRGNYISYYDVWDLDPTGSTSRINALANRHADRAGRGFEIYGRIYYDPRTFQPLEPVVPRDRD